MNDFLGQLNPTDGHILAGVQIDEHRFLARVKMPQLESIAPDPRDTEDKRKLASIKELQELRDIRDDVQRLFEGQKAKNVAPYASYIVDVHHGADGMTPPIILYSEKALPVAVDDRFGFGAISVPFGQKLVAIDGETQLAARFEAANREPATRGGFVAVYICHGRNKAWARQAFHDLNVLAVRPNTAVSIGMDARDPLTAIAREVEQNVSFFRGRVNKVRRQLRSTDQEIVTIAALRGACITVAEGIGGVRYGSRPVPLPDKHRAEVLDATVHWLAAVGDAIGAAMEDRDAKLASAPSVLAAIGAMGHALLGSTGAERDAKLAQQLALLRQVDWSRGKHWEGIAGKFTPKGVLAVGGSKETAYAIFGALSDDTSPAFRCVRPQLEAAAI
ncbi:MAG: DNA sulfur modification protein DndB [Rhodospirillales bacterium]|nr:DNA sulfur modification protein DndB [Rhodospirillales bacterium]